MIPYGRQQLNQDDIDAVVKVLQSDWLTQGPVLPKFEQALADYCQAQYAVAVNSATSALHLGCLALGLGPGDWLWTSPNTFVASANCALYCGAQVDFVDIDPQTYNLSVEKLEAKLIWAEQQGCLPKVIVVVHFAGQSCEMQKIAILSAKYGFKVIEDAAHAVGGQYLQQPIGNCAYSDLSVFSFHPVKVMTCGEGGAITTNSPELYQKIKQLRSHGITKETEFFQQATQEPWYYEQQALGYNYRMTELQAALGLSQLQRLDSFIQHRSQLANQYNRLLESLPISLPYQHPDTKSAWHLYVIQVAAEARSSVFSQLRAQGIGVQVHYIPVHTQPYYQRLGFEWGDYPEAENYYLKAITLPIFFDMEHAQQVHITNILKNILHD